MSRRGARGSIGLIAAIASLLALGTQAVAGAVLWTMTASPLTATVGTSATFTLTATNLDPLLGVKCVVAYIPSAIAPGDVWIAGSNTTANWVASRSGQQVTAVISTGDGNAKLRVGDWVAFAFNAVSVQSGTYAINAVAYSGHECVNGARPLAAPPVVVISGSLVPPPPVPTPPPPPPPTPTPKPIVVLPSILPTARPQPPAVPAVPTRRVAPAAPTPTPGVQAIGTTRTQRPAPSPTAAAAPPSTSAPTPRPVGAGVASAVPTPPPPAATSDSRPLALPRGEPGEGEVSLAFGQFGAIDGLAVWAIPGAAVGGPGLIVILWVAIQAGVALAWVPAVRRLRGDGRFGGRARRT